MEKDSANAGSLSPNELARNLLSRPELTSMDVSKDSKRPHISCTQLDMFRKCPQQYAFRYLLGLKQPPSASFGFGLAFDKAINEEYLHKMEHGTDLDVSKCQEVFAADWATRRKEIEFKPGEDPGKINDEGAALVPVFHKDVCQQVQPVVVQEMITVQLSGVDYDLQTVIDVVDNDHIEGEVVVDNKTAARSWDEGREFTETQPVAYCIARASIGKPTNVFRFDIGVRGKNPHVEARVRRIGEGEVIGFMKLLGHVRAAITAGVFYPNQNGWWCSKKWCGFWEQCQREWHINVKE
jgi:hypothetical protein